MMSGLGGGLNCHSVEFAQALLLPVAAVEETRLEGTENIGWTLAAAGMLAISIIRMSRLLAPLKTGSVKSQVFNTLKRAIFSGKLEPGKALRELELARELNVSQATVREALFKLEHTGLVTRAPNRGSYVTTFSDAEIRERLEIRVLLEGFAAIEASRKMNEESFRELNQKLRALSKAVAKQQYYEFTQADLEFHRYIWHCSGSKTLAQTLDQLCAPLFAFVSVRRSTRKEDLRQAQSHEVIVEAIKQGIPDNIREEIRLHIERSYKKSSPGPDDVSFLTVMIPES